MTSLRERALLAWLLAAVALALAAGAPARADDLEEGAAGEAELERMARLVESDARAELEAGNLERAAELARAAAELVPTAERLAFRAELLARAAAHFREQGDAAFAAQHWDDAIGAYRKAASFEPLDAQLEERLASARQRREVALALDAEKRGEIERAAEHARRARELEEDLHERRRLAQLAPEGLRPARVVPRSGAEIFAESRRSLVVVESATGSGLGVVIGPDVVLTHGHVLDGSAGSLRTPSGRVLRFYRAAPHAVVDLALVFVRDLDVEPAPVGAGLQLRRGERVSVVGSQGLALGYENGSVVRVGRSFAGRAQVIQFTGLVFTTGGGPLFDRRGNLVGLALPTVVGGPSVHYAVPVEYGLELLQRPRP